MTWAIMCECSGVFRDAFLAAGIDAVSIDLKPTQRPGPHIQGDALDYLHKRWSGVIAHPVCRVLTNAGAKHLYIEGRKENGPNLCRWRDLGKAVNFYSAFRRANAPKIAIENQVMHCHAMILLGGPKRHFVQPWWFGDPAFKATGWELYGLPALHATDRLIPPKPGTEDHKRWSFIHRMPPGPNREEKRSESFPGMARAAAAQWGNMP